MADTNKTHKAAVKTKKNKTTAVRKKTYKPKKKK
jgi:hypothetical protein